MILADKIVRLRKKNGYSQEELAEKINVSRQAVSKWEGAQTIPDLDKILQLANLFGVTTDYLLKDEIEIEEFTKDTPDSGIRKVSIQEANNFIKHRKWASSMIAVATSLCIISPVALIILAGANELNLGITENMVAGVGLLSLFIIVTIAVAMFFYCGFKNTPYKFLDENEPFELEYGVSGMVKEKQKAFRNKYALCNVIATCLCILSPVPLILGGLSGNEFLTTVFLGVTLLLAAIGVGLFVFAGVRMASMQKLLKEGEYTFKEKKKRTLKETVALVYWLVLVSLYLVLSFTLSSWSNSWLIFAVGALLFAALMAILNLFEKKEEN